MNILLPLLVCVVIAFPEINGHGRLLVPPGRSTAWREGFNTPENYNDNELNCGGFNNQWETNDGQCGLCGDPYQGPLENEAGGKYATGTIVRQYSAGAVIDVTVQITANHKGYHQFRLCEHNDPSSRITQQCLDEHLLPDAVTGNTDHTMGEENKDYTYQLQLPAGLTCSLCVLQWKYNAGNSWGVDPDTGEEGVGMGPQEQFYGCADVAITGTGNSTTTTGTPGTGSPTTTGAPVTTTLRATQSTTSSGSSSGINCVPTEVYADDPNMAEWCNVNCAAGYCPSTHCVCVNQVKGVTCVPVVPWTKVSGMGDWCRKTCKQWQPACEGHCTCK